MARSREIPVLVLVILASFCVSSSFAETIELVTYYPSPVAAGGAGGDVRARSLSVGTTYAGVVLDDGEAIIRTNLGIGPGFDTLAPAGPLHVMGENNQASRVLFMPGGGTGTIRVGIGSLNPPSLLGLGVDTLAAGTRQAVTVGNAGLGAPTAEGTTSNGDKLVMWNSTVDPVHKAAIGLDTNQELWLQSSGNNSNNHISFYTSDNSTTPLERMRITSDGFVGIGTSDPAAKLHVYDPADSAIVLGRADDSAALSVWRYNGGAVDFGTVGGDGLRFFTNSSSRLHIDGDGRVGIGKDSDNIFTLDVNGFLAVRDTRTYLVGLDGSSHHWIMVAGISEPNDNALGFHYPTKSISAGPIWNFVESSDVRLKTDIAPVTGALEKIASLRGVRYHFADPAAPREFRMGVIAQEVEKVFPELVTTTSDGFKTVAYTRLVSPLIEAVKELKAENDLLKRRVEALEKKR